MVSVLIFMCAFVYYMVSFTGKYILICKDNIL